MSQAYIWVKRKGLSDTVAKAYVINGTNKEKINERLGEDKCEVFTNGTVVIPLEQGFVKANVGDYFFEYEKGNFDVISRKAFFSQWEILSTKKSDPGQRGDSVQESHSHGDGRDGESGVNHGDGINTIISSGFTN